MITQKTLKESLSYDPESGEFTWTDRSSYKFTEKRYRERWNKLMSGRSAGAIQNSRRTKYRVIMINGRSYKAHRLAFLYMTGEMPEMDVDHIDGNGCNNSWVNLRQATSSQNSRNRRMSKRNKTSSTGVYYRENLGKWVASIWNNGKNEYLGVFSDIDEAIKVRSEAQYRLGYSERHGL